MKNIAIIGANGILGPAVLKALLDAGTFNVRVIKRASSKSTYPASAETVTVDDNFQHDDLVKALAAQDALVVTLSGSKREEQIKLADAAVAAGVQRFIPADFGSCDSADEVTQRLLPLFAGKAQVRAYLDQLAHKPGSSLSWTALVTGHFFDYGLRTKLLHFDVKQRVAELLDGGDVKFSATTLSTIGLAVVRILQNPEATKNRLLYAHSFCITQRQLLAALERAMVAHGGGNGTKRWQVHALSSKDLITENKAKAEQGDGEAIEEIVASHGIVASNWEGKKDFANALLELPAEDLDQVVADVVKDVHS